MKTPKQYTKTSENLAHNSDRKTLKNFGEKKKETQWIWDEATSNYQYPVR